MWMSDMKEEKEAIKIYSKFQNKQFCVEVR